MRVSIPILLGMAIAAACSSPTEACGCPPVRPHSAVATGELREASGVSVAGVVATAIVRRGACPGAADVEPSIFSSPPSDSAGRYRLNVDFGVYEVGPYCTQFSAQRVRGASPEVVSNPPINLLLATPTPNAIRVDFTFPPPAGASGRHAP